MGKLLRGFVVLAALIGCDRAPDVAEPTPETAPWLFPDEQMKLLAAPDFKVRALAARNLGKMGAAAEPAIPELEKLLEDDNEKVRDIAQEALDKIRAALGNSPSP